MRLITIMKAESRLFSLLLMVMLPIYAHAFQNEPLKEFKGIQWGSELTKEYICEPLGEEDLFKAECYRDGDEDSYLGVKTGPISYLFYGEAFYAVSMSFITQDRADAMSQQLVKEFGNAQEVRKTGADETTSYWEGDDIYIEYIQRDNAQASSQAILYMESKSVYDKANEKALNEIDAALKFLDGTNSGK